MGGSGGRGFGRYKSTDIRRWIDEAAARADHTEHDATVTAMLGDLLAQYNDRDVDLIGDRLESIKQAIQDSIETTLDLKFGGSVAKHTYVDGLSDVDTLAILRDQELASLDPSAVLSMFRDILRRELPRDAQVTVGSLAVTVQYSDGMKIQLLPAVPTGDGVKIPASNGQEWSQVIRPQAFASKLTERNQECNGRLVPTIKLAKAALEMTPDSIRPNGYHVESLAVEAFKGYTGPKTPKAMLQHFFHRGSQLVLDPIRDNTGQSLNVDAYLGASNSNPRLRLSGIMSRIARRMENADRTASAVDWLAAIGE